MNHKLTSRFLGETSTTLDIQMVRQKKKESGEEIKNLMMRVKEKSEKSC